ncbi:hypothetical protein VTO42DRAFT_6718 [Malbranchea cinnamomea]
MTITDISTTITAGFSSESGITQFCVQSCDTTTMPDFWIHTSDARNLNTSTTPECKFRLQPWPRAHSGPTAKTPPELGPLLEFRHQAWIIHVSPGKGLPWRIILPSIAGPPGKYSA